MKPRKRRPNRSLGQLLGIFAGLLLGATVLLLHVWLPIQSQRASRELQTWERKLSEDKWKLQQVQSRLKKMTSLNLLDQWAKKNGPWKTAKKGDIISFYE